MRPLGIVLVLSLVLCSFSDAAQVKVDVLDPNCYPMPGCFKIFRPVCGTDGKTYLNTCELCHANKKRKVPVRIKKRGKC